MKLHILGLSCRYDHELLASAAAELFLQLGALHKRHAAHLHGTPDHPGWVTPLLRADPFVGATIFPLLGFSDYAFHFESFLSFSLVCAKSSVSRDITSSTACSRLRTVRI